ncbi:hypothetical protein SESBI_04127 [Sesbania bispinosa]|nr:hypothetical protein SESBI_04127 [Sesbania bispinosa]
MAHANRSGPQNSIPADHAQIGTCFERSDLSVSVSVINLQIRILRPPESKPGDCRRHLRSIGATADHLHTSKSCSSFTKRKLCYLLHTLDRALLPVMIHCYFSHKHEQLATILYCTVLVFYFSFTMRCNTDGKC